jgi:glycosyltransferase involved in cell wall biosynthesis
LEKILKILGKNKTFDIVIPCFNTEDYIHKTIKSVFSLTYKNFHIYLIDDKSTDSTYSILKEYGKYPNITVISNINNLGKYKSINQMIDQLKSDYYLVLDSDDVLTKNRLVYDLMAFAQNDKILLVQSKYFRYNEITEKIILEPSYGENIITFDRKIFGMVGKYYDSRFGADTEFLERVLKFLGDEIVYQFDKLTYIAIIRKDSSNLTKTIEKKDRIRFVRKYRKLHELNNVNFFINICK